MQENQYNYQLQKRMLRDTFFEFIEKALKQNHIKLLNREQVLLLMDNFKNRIEEDPNENHQKLSKLIKQIETQGQENKGQKMVETNKQKQIYYIPLYNPELTQLRFMMIQQHIEDQLQDYADQITDMKKCLLTMRCPPYIQNLFEQTKQLTIKIIENSNNKFLETYFQFFIQYRQIYNIAVQKHNQQIDKMNKKIEEEQTSFQKGQQKYDKHGMTSNQKESFQNINKKEPPIIQQKKLEKQNIFKKRRYSFDDKNNQRTSAVEIPDQFDSLQNQRFIQKQKNIKKKRQKLGEIQIDFIKNTLIKGIRQSTIIFYPNQDRYGETVKKKILVNCYKFFKEHNITKIQQSKVKLLKTVLSLTILHELTHFTIRSLNGNDIEGQKSFNYEQINENQRYLSLKKKYTNCTCPLLTNENMNVEKASILIKVKDQILLNLEQKIIKEYNIDTILQKIKKSVTKDLLFKNVLNPQSLQKIFKEINQNYLKTLQNELEKSDVLATLIKQYLQFQKEDNKQAQKLLSKYLILEKQDPCSFNEKINYAVLKTTLIKQSILELIIETIKAYKIHYQDMKEISEFKVQNIIQLTKDLKLQSQLKKLLNLNGFVQDKQQYKKHIDELSEIFNQSFQIQKKTTLGKYLKKTFGKIDQKTIKQVILAQNIMKIRQIISQFDSQYFQYKQIRPIYTHKSAESGWIMEERLFPRLHLERESFIYETDYERLLQLSTCTSGCLKLRKEFGDKNANLQTQKIKSVVSRNSQRNQQNYTRIPFTSCRHFEQRYGFNRE